MVAGYAQIKVINIKQVNIRKKYEKGAVLYTAESRTRHENPEKRTQELKPPNPDWV